MNQTIGAYRSITVTPAFREMDRLRSKARHDEAQALSHAAEEERKKWQSVVADLVADKDAIIADKDVALADKDAALTDKDIALADKDIALADKDAIITELRTRLGEN